MSLDGSETQAVPSESLTFNPEPADTECDAIELDICSGIRDTVTCLKKLSKYGMAVFEEMETLL